MEQAYSIGAVVLALGTLANLYFTFKNNSSKNDDKITDILISLEKYATSLDNFTKTHEKDYGVLRERVDKHGREIDEVRGLATKNENEIKHLKEDLKEHKH